MILGHQLLMDYNHFRKSTRHYQRLRSTRPAIANLKSTPARLRALEEMVVWCREKSVDPRAWLYFLFARAKWHYPPQLDAAHLTATKHFPDFHQFDFGYFRRYLVECNSATISDPVFDPRRDLAPAVEDFKRSLLHQNAHDRCMEMMDSETYGYHPRSTVCARCPVAGQCAQQLQAGLSFDVLALRRGHTTLDAIRMQVTAHAMRPRSYGVQQSPSR